MINRVTGDYKKVSTTGETFDAFIPRSLPPNPPIEWTNQLHDLFHEALVAIGRLDSVITLLPDPNLFIYSYVRKEAVLSSMIEGTQSSLSDLLLHEQGYKTKIPLDDVTEVSSYLSALHHGLKRLDEGFPLVLRLIREMHSELLKTGRGSRLTPGEFRRSQNWVGGSRPGNAKFVPPPPEDLNTCLGDLENFINDIPNRTPTLLKAALAHVQFETIHPFLDGNGRIGRLLITLLLNKEGLLQEPILYLSLFFKENRQEYYDRLARVRTHGDWEGWLEYFALGIRETANQAVNTAKLLSKQIEIDQKVIVDRLGASSGSAILIHNTLSKRLIVKIKTLEKDTNLTFPTVNTILKKLEKENIVSEISNKKRNKTYFYNRLYEIINNHKFTGPY